MPDTAVNSWEARADQYSFYGFTDLPTIHQRGPVVLTHGQGPYVDRRARTALPRRELGPLEHGRGLRSPRHGRRRQGAIRPLSRATTPFSGGWPTPP